MDLRTDKAEFAVEFIDIEAAAEIAGVWWEPHQIEFLNNSTRFGIDVKARQIAASFTMACDAVVDSVLNPGTPGRFAQACPHIRKKTNSPAKAMPRAGDMLCTSAWLPGRDRIATWMRFGVRLG